MKVLAVPAGWEQLERHLAEWHAIPEDHLDVIDADAARALHRTLHGAPPSFQRRTETRPHRHHA